MDGQTHVKQYVQDLKYKLCDKSCINCTWTHRNQNSLKKNPAVMVTIGTTMLM